MENYANQTFSNYAIVAIEETEILEISKTDMDNLLSKFNWWKDFLLSGQQKTIMKMTDLFYAKCGL